MAARLDPATINFSLYCPGIDSTNYHDHQDDVSIPLYQVLCQDGNFIDVVATRGGKSECKNHQKGDWTLGQEDKDHHIQDEYTVLMKGSTYVEDRHFEDTKFTAWTLSFYVLQMGQPILDTTDFLGAFTPRDHNGGVTSQHASQVLNEVLRLKLQDSLGVDGKLENFLNVPNPCTGGTMHMSVAGREYATWSADGIVVGKEDITTSGVPQHHSLLPEKREMTGVKKEKNSHFLRNFALVFLVIAGIWLRVVRKKLQKRRFVPNVPEFELLPMSTSNSHQV